MGREFQEKQDHIWQYYQNLRSDAFEDAKPRLDFLLRQIMRKMKPGKPVVLNVGAGNGYLETMAANKGWEVSSIDPDKKSIDQLKKIGINAHQGYVEKMPYADASFDFVIASEVLEHLSDDQLSDGISEIHRILRPDGWFLGTVPFNEDLTSNEVICPKCGEIFHRWGHLQHFSLSDLNSLLSARFRHSDSVKKVFIDFGKRNMFGKIKGVVRIILSKGGVAVAVPSIFFCACK